MRILADHPEISLGRALITLPELIVDGISAENDWVLFYQGGIHHYGKYVVNLAYLEAYLFFRQVQGV